MRTLFTKEDFANTEEAYLKRMGRLAIKPQYFVDIRLDDLKEIKDERVIKVMEQVYAVEVYKQTKEQLLRQKDAYIRGRERSKYPRKEDWETVVGWEFNCYLLSKFRDKYNLEK